MSIVGFFYVEDGIKSFTSLIKKRVSYDKHLFNDYRYRSMFILWNNIVDF